MSDNNNSLTNELTGNTNGGIETDHGGVGIGDLIVLLLDAVLLIYTAWRSYDFLTTTVPNGFQMLAMVGLWGLDIGAVAWSLVWIFGSTEKYQDWTSMTFFVIDLVGVVLTSLTDSLMYGAKGGAMTGTLSGVAIVVIPLIVVFNVVAGFIYHMTSPETKARRTTRKADAEHKRKMGEINDMERDLRYAEQYLLAKQDTLDKATLLAEIKTGQDALEKATRAKLRDQLGIHSVADSINGRDSGEDKLAEWKKHLADIKAKLANLSPSNPTDGDTEPGLVTPSSSVETLAPAAHSPINLTPVSLPIPHPVLPPADEAVPVMAPSESAVKGNGHSKPSPL